MSLFCSVFKILGKLMAKVVKQNVLELGDLNETVNDVYFCVRFFVCPRFFGLFVSVKYALHLIIVTGSKC